MISALDRRRDDYERAMFFELDHDKLLVCDEDRSRPRSLLPPGYRSPRCGGSVRIEAAIRHQLTAAGLVAGGVNDLVAEALQELERCDADFRKEGVDMEALHYFTVLTSREGLYRR